MLLRDTLTPITLLRRLRKFPTFSPDFSSGTQRGTPEAVAGVLSCFPLMTMTSWKIGCLGRGKFLPTHTGAGSCRFGVWLVCKCGLRCCDRTGGVPGTTKTSSLECRGNGSGLLESLNHERNR